MQREKKTMAKLTLADLRALRDASKKGMEMRDSENKGARVIVSMGTCGIAAGAKATFDAFIEQLMARGMTDVLVSQTGCMGFCQHEPTIEVAVPGMESVVYGDVKGDVVEKIINGHLVGKEILIDHRLEKPSIDIIKEA